MWFDWCMLKSILTIALLPLCSASIAHSECEPGMRVSLEEIGDQNQAVLVGELHGTKEMPAEFLRVVERLSMRKSKVVVALEYNVLWQNRLDEMFSSGSVETFRQKYDELSTGDGRTSEAMKGLAEGLWRLQKDEGNLIIAAVDYWRKDHPDDSLSIPDWLPDEVKAENSIRDIRMGENAVLACRSHDCDLLLYFAGNFHTRNDISTGGMLNTETGKIKRFAVATSGAIIGNEMKMASIYLSHRGGEITANVNGEFGARAFNANTPDYVLRDHTPYCSKQTRTSHDYIMSVGTISSSIDASD